MFTIATPYDFFLFDDFWMEAHLTLSFALHLTSVSGRMKCVELLARSLLRDLSDGVCSLYLAQAEVWYLRQTSRMDPEKRYGQSSL